MLALRIEVRQQLARVRCHMSCLGILTGEDPDGIQRFEARDREEFHLVTDGASKHGGATIACDVVRRR
jgi:hypothetical protein